MLPAAHSNMNRRLLSGNEVEEVISQGTAKDMDLAFHKHGLVRILPEGWLYSGKVPTYLDNIYTMTVSIRSIIYLHSFKTNLCLVMLMCIPDIPTG